jgi:hypothetical protein
MKEGNSVAIARCLELLFLHYNSAACVIVSNRLNSLSQVRAQRCRQRLQFFLARKAAAVMLLSSMPRRLEEGLRRSADRIDLGTVTAKNVTRLQRGNADGRR